MWGLLGLAEGVQAYNFAHHHGGMLMCLKGVWAASHRGPRAQQQGCPRGMPRGCHVAPWATWHPTGTPTMAPRWLAQNMGGGHLVPQQGPRSGTCC